MGSFWIVQPHLITRIIKDRKPSPVYLARRDRRWKQRVEGCAWQEDGATTKECESL